MEEGGGTSTKRLLDNKDDDSEEEQLCPWSWFWPRKKATAREVFWKMTFISCCLPICWPCYASRTLRQRKRCPRSLIKESGTFLDPMSKTLKSQSETTDKNLTINAIVLKSRLSNLLSSQIKKREEELKSRLHRSDAIRQHLKPLLDEPSGAGDRRMSKFKSIFRKRRKSVIRNSHETRQMFDIIQEDDPEADQVPLRKHAYPSVARGPKRDAQGRQSKWQRLKTFSRVTMKFSSAKRTSAGVDAAGDVVDAAGTARDRDDDDLKPEKMVEVTDLGQRQESVAGYCVSFSVYDEASVSEWNGQDLRVAKTIPNIDVLVIAVKRGDVQDLREMLQSGSGIVHYVSNLWRGFYPLLLIEIEDILAKDPSGDNDDDDDDSDDYAESLAMLIARFGDVHRVRIPDHTLYQNLDWLHQSLAKLFIHSRIFQCSRFFDCQVFDDCPGGCELKTNNHYNYTTTTTTT